MKSSIFNTSILVFFLIILPGQSKAETESGAKPTRNRIYHRNGNCYLQRGGKTIQIKNKKRAALLCRASVSRIKRKARVRKAPQKRATGKKHAKRRPARRKKADYKLIKKYKSTYAIYENKRCYILRENRREEIKEPALKELLCQTPGKKTLVAYKKTRPRNPDNHKFSALWRSLIVPGWGQHFQGHKGKGRLFFSSSVLLAGLMAAEYSKVQTLSQRQNTYANSTLAYWGISGSASVALNLIRLQNFQTMNTGSARLRRANAGLKLVSGTLLGLYIYNLVDAYFFSPPKEQTTILSLKATPRLDIALVPEIEQTGTQGKRIAVTYSWRF